MGRGSSGKGKGKGKKDRDEDVFLMNGYLNVGGKTSGLPVGLIRWVRTDATYTDSIDAILEVPEEKRGLAFKRLLLDGATMHLTFPANEPHIARVTFKKVDNDDKEFAWGSVSVDSSKGFMAQKVFDKLDGASESEQAAAVADFVEALEFTFRDAVKQQGNYSPVNKSLLADLIAPAPAAQ